MAPWKNLSVIRKVVQLLAFTLLVYGSPLVGFYAADKLTRNLPALACAYNSETADYCVLIPLQHQMAHRVGVALANHADLLSALLPLATTLVSFLLLFVVLNKAFCGWICPLGFVQEMLHLLGRKLGLQQHESLPAGTVQKIRPLKWAMLALLVIIFPLLTGLGLADHSLGNPFCSICPSRIMSTLLTGNTSELYVDTSGTGFMLLSVVADFLFGLMLALGLTVRQPFCRICPMLAMHATFRKVGLLRLVKNARPRCEKCGLCAKACPMDIREIHTEMDKRDVTFADCTLCGRCVEFCPDKGVLQLQYARIPLFNADPAYFKERKKAQTRWDKLNLRSWWQQRWGGN